MLSYPSAEDVADDLGEKVVAGFIKAVSMARDDLADYRAKTPSYVSQSTERGLANWIHDRLWTRLREIFDEAPDITFVDKEPRREMRVGLKHLFRVKRHTATGDISTYPTQTALDFFEQVAVQDPFEGFEQLRLTMGYVWDPEARQVGDAVMCLHSEMNKIVWLRSLDELVSIPQSGATPLPTRDEPARPVIEVRRADKEEDSGTDTR